MLCHICFCITLSSSPTFQYTDCYCLEAVSETSTAHTHNPEMTTTAKTITFSDRSSESLTTSELKPRSANMEAPIPEKKETLPEVLVVASSTVATLSTLVVNGSLTSFDNGTLTRHHAHLDVGSTSLTALWIVVGLLSSICLLGVSFFLWHVFTPTT